MFADFPSALIPAWILGAPSYLRSSRGCVRPGLGRSPCWLRCGDGDCDA